MNNDRGSILFVLMFSALTGAIIMVFVAIMHNTLITQKRAAARMAFVDFVENIRATVNDPFICETLLRGQPLANSGVLNRNSFNDNLIIGDSAPNYFPGGAIRKGSTDISNNFVIDEVRISVNHGDLLRSPPYTIDHPLRVLQYDRPPPYGNDFLAYKTRIQFQAKVKGFFNFYLNTMDPNRPEYWVDLIVNVDGAGRIFSCHGPGHTAEACEMRGGAYDASTFMNSWPDLRCHPANDLCWPGPSVYTTGAVALPAMPQQPNCPWPYTEATWAGRVGGQDRWLCTWCNNKRWTPNVD